MALNWLIEDPEEYISRGDRILSVLDGSGSVDVLPGRPDIEASPSDFDKGEKFNPEIDFDPNSYSRIDKFDGVELGHEYIESRLDSSRESKAKPSATERSEVKD
ncbi:MAG: hypothetical protein [Chaetfec virus UA24_2231]|nr:MAG: hypothetical protein [Chaetfec virus UA24_2231]